VCDYSVLTFLMFHLEFQEFYDLWHSLPVPNDVDLLKALSSGKSCSLCVTLYSR
jgi:hypothetical protein